MQRRLHIKGTFRPSWLGSFRPFPLLACALVMLLCFALSTATAARYTRLHGGLPPHPNLDQLMSPLQPTLTAGFDLVCFQGRFLDWGTPAFYGHPAEQMFNYPPPAAVVLRGMYASPLLPVTTFRVLLAAWLVLAGSFAALALRRAGLGWPMLAVTVTAFLFLSEPLFTLEFVSNFELFVWIVLSVGVWAFVTGRPWLAAICFGIAGSFKYFPLAFLGLFANRAGWQKLAAGLATFAVSLGAGLVAVGPAVRVALAGLARQTALFTQTYIDTWQPSSSPIDHSLVGLFKLLFHIAGRMAWMPVFMHIYLPTVGLALLAGFFLWIRKLPPLNQILLFTVIAVWLPPLSHDYTLVHLYAPLILMVLYALRTPPAQTARWPLLAAFLCMGLLLAHLRFFWLREQMFGGQLRCVVLGLLFIIALRRDLFRSHAAFVRFGPAQIRDVKVSERQRAELCPHQGLLT